MDLDVIALAGPVVDEATYRLAFESSAVGIAIVDPAGTILRANAALHAFLGWPGELVGVPWSAVALGDDRVDEEAHLARLAGGDVSSVSFEQRYVRPDGTEAWGLVTCSALPAEVPSLAGFVAQVQDVGDRKAAEARLTELALHDPLTGLPNRALFLDQVRLGLRRSERSGALLALLFLDLDRFKVVNDSKGHAAGDALLRTVAARMARSVRPQDIVARLGGDEFVVLCEDLGSPAEALAIARRLNGVLTRPIDLAGREVVSSASIGIALSQPGVTAEDLLRQADAAMYQAKDAGRARAALFDPALLAAAEGRLDVEAELRRALVGRQMRTWFQPQWSLRDGRLTGVEALVRWEHPTRGLLAPGAFLGVAEESGLVRDIGTVVLEEACTQASRWLAVRPDLMISVNLSARQLDTPGFSTLVKGVLDHHGLAPANLCFEVTESLLIDLRGTATRQLGQLRALGTHLALDDFGTGWSSLSHLTTFPVSMVKVDRAFVAQVEDRTSRGSAVVGAVAGLAHALGLEAIAEGAESQEQVDRLRALGCDGVQGYHLGRPMPAADVAGLL